VSLSLRTEIVEYVKYWKTKTLFAESWFCKRLGIRQARFSQWKRRDGIDNRHNGKIPKDFWLTPEEKRLIVDYYVANKDEGYRRCTYMMIDEDVVYASPSTVFRVLKNEGVLRSKKNKESKKGNGFDQPLKPHEHWHTDISYIKIEKQFHFLICVLDGFSRKILHWDLRVTMTDQDILVVQQAALEKFPGVNPRFITDNGGQFTGAEFRKFVSFHGLTHVRTSPYYPQSSGKLERFHATIKNECIRKKALLDQDHAKGVIAVYVEYYNTQRLHSAIGYITPHDKISGNAEQIKANRENKLENARRLREEQANTKIVVRGESHPTGAQRSGAGEALTLASNEISLTKGLIMYQPLPSGERPPISRSEVTSGS
jgi:transposase InsO family protein